MDRSILINELNQIIGGYLETQGIELVELIYRYEGKDLVLRILVDKPEGGITLDECVRLNNAIGLILDEKGILEERYILEVSSPGLDRPLRTKKDFLRCLNRKVRFFLTESINGKMELEGIIKKVEENAVYVDVEGQILEISFIKMNLAKQALNF
ncbi:MAG: ribosome maturation factor RimP [Candidatus Omnitrophica bacterium]|nr:ribosome maturation factor RimP [Candidatus Omnitrophota bacterium]